MCVLSRQAQLGEESVCNAGGLGSIPGLGRSPGEGKATYSSIWLGESHGLCSPRDHRGSDRTERLSLSLHQVTSVDPTLCDPVDCSLPGSSVHGKKGKNTGVGCHALLQGTFLSQGSNLHLLHLLNLAGGFFTTTATWEAPLY